MIRKRQPFIISIHSPRMRGDARPVAVLYSVSRYFNPLPSHEGRHQRDVNLVIKKLISIHSPRMRGDFVAKLHAGELVLFQSTPLA